MRRSTRFGLTALAAFAVACGARTGLDVDARDGGAALDAGADAARDSGPEVVDAARPDAFACAVECGDGVFCNGVEFCDERSGRCEPGEPPDCDDLAECTIDTCDRATDACVHVEMDRDEDADGVSACGGDCDDRDPGIRPGVAEVCDGRDQNCNRVVDEGVLSECADCRPGCHVVVLPRGAGGWTAEAESMSGVEVRPDGTLVLSSTRTEQHFAYIANHLFGSITKLDTRDGAQVAEYDSVLVGRGNHAEEPGSRCLTLLPGGNCPSRTAVDLRGNVYVANRAFGGQGSVTKIAGFEEDCVDRDGDGTIETSRDVDGDGRIERSVTGEFLGQRDECLVWTVDAGPENGIPRAIAVAADGTIWVGLHEHRRVLQLAPEDGRQLRSISVGTFQPYGAAIDGRGRLWLTEAGTGRIVSIDTATGTVGLTHQARSRDRCSGSYGIAIDAEDRVWIAGLQCPAAFRFDPATSRWFEVRLPDSGAGRGIAVDDRGFVWMAASHEWVRLGDGPLGITAGPEIARITRFRADDGGDVRIFGTGADPIPGSVSIGIGIDSSRRVWAINQNSSTATRLDPVTGETREFPVGESPYTYSDFTGFALRTFTAPNGFLRTVLEGCAVGPTEWERLSWDADLRPGTRIELRVRAAATRAALPSAAWIGPFGTLPADLALPPGPVPAERFLEIEVMLVSDDAVTSPALRTVTVQYNCPV